MSEGERCPHRADAVGCAFSALEPDEEREVRAHLPGCDECRRALEEALEVVAALGASVPALDPPPALRARVLDAARRGDAPTPGTDPVWFTLPALPAPSTDGTAPVAPADTRAPVRRRRAPLALVLVAAVVLGLGLVVAQAVLPTRTGGGEPPAVTLAQQADQVVDDARAHDPGLHSAVLRGDDGQPTAVVLDPSDDLSGTPRVVPLALPPPEVGQGYVLWATGGPGSRPVAVATLDTLDGSTRPVDAAAPPTTAVPRGYAVSVEPAGPVPAQPSTVVAVGITA